MLMIPALAVLLTYVYWRPQQVFEFLSPISLNLVVAFALLGLVLDLRLKQVRLRGSPLLVLLGALTAWCIATVAIQAPGRLGDNLGRFTIALLVFVLVSEGLQTTRALGVVARVLFSFTVGLAALGVHQGLQPSVCYIPGTGPIYDSAKDVSDGRPCATRADCHEGGDPAVEAYVCEHPGALGTHSIGGRVRYRGILEDPNELAWALCMGLPLAFALYEQRRSKARLAVLAGAVVLAGACTVMTQSRSGQLGMLAMVGVYFVRRFRTRGLVAAAALGLPLLLLGGRSGTAAEASTEERLLCWAEAISMWREHPVLGVGAGQFTDHYYTTAHNSFLLALAELGPLGMLLWSAAVYYAFKMTVRAQLDLADRPEAAPARSWAMALLASLVGLVISSMFLTLTYHTVLWIYLGLAGALYSAIRTHAPEFRVRFGWRDAALVVAGDVVLVAVIAVYLRVKGV